jgi:hypothetical protein
MGDLSPLGRSISRVAIIAIETESNSVKNVHVDGRFKHENKQPLIRLATINNFNDAANKGPHL